MLISSQKRQTVEHTRTPLEIIKKLKMGSSSQDASFNTNYVIMPWEDETEIIFTIGDGCDSITNVCSRWELIQKQLHNSTQILNVDSLVNVIKSYNVVFDKDGRQMKPPWKCLALHQYFARLDDYEKIAFFKECGILSTIRNLALQLKDLLPKLKVLKTGCADSVNLHQMQIACLLANAFLCTFPKAKVDCPSINFNTLFESSSSSVLEYYVEKIKCIIHYFRRIHEKQPTGNLSFHRLCIPDHDFPRWDRTTSSLCSLRVDVNGRIEDQDGFLQMDFANQYVGGGVLGRGCVQEEIRFLICPELIGARLFTECLADNESLFVVGAERYCQYSGYSNTFKFAGDYQDGTPFDENRRRKTYLIVLDALYYQHSSEQYRESKILRELKKAYVGFKPLDGVDVHPLATGNWGCGAFNGDPQLKSIVQLMASSQARRDMLYLTHGNSLLKSQMEEIYQLLKEKEVNVGMLYRIIRLYNRERRRNQTVFEFVREVVNRREKRKSFFETRQSNSPTRGFVFESSDDRRISSMEEATSANPKPRKDDRPSDEKPTTSQENFPEMDVDFEALDRDVEINSNKKIKSLVSRYSSSHQRESRGPVETSNILDVIWFENEVPSKRKPAEEPAGRNDSEEMDLTVESVSPSSEGQGRVTQLVETRSENGVTSVLTEDADMFDPEYGLPGNVAGGSGKPVVKEEEKPKKMIQKRITDCFFKK